MRQSNNPYFLEMQEVLSLKTKSSCQSGQYVKKWIPRSGQTPVGTALEAAFLF
jgi:hypothetical protein